MFPQGEPIIVSQDAGVFTMIMATLFQYEKHVSLKPMVAAMCM